MATIIQLKKELDKLSSPRQAKISQRFFKTNKGEYGEGDIFLGVKVPVQRKIAKNYQSLSLQDIKTLLNSEIHEYRLTSLFILIAQYKKENARKKEKIFNLYLKNARQINNWDLVDLSAPNIIGDYLLDKPKIILLKLAKSKNLWEKRIAILATYAFIKNNKFNDALKISKILLNDNHDLIHKATGWMLREIGKRNQKIEERFLKKHYKKMPRTMLRYAIEKFDESKRKFYLKK
ncbi:MAG: putative DNA alkylation repair enzyme [Parcubacteria group bacterium Athens1014_10]|nr:MAG: putative DNA alkylation repair enzyme [Parcubacteria group bacterium Athens1014_10]TSD05888.1 MAG: putative DNA alkylation repair enzyme [Parcubacteria group bacterium Athens0714_12]